MSDPNADPRSPKPINREAETVAGSQTPSGPPSFFAGARDIPRLPSMVGKYRVISMIGQGGMGAVYLAEQDNPRRTVALKVIKPNIVSRSLLKRFELEAQVLGRLQHPGIAQIFEAGTFDAGEGAQPFFAMEYVKGRPLTELVLERDAPMQQRLELLAKICDAVHHAHQKGIVHRDLKPGNILVMDEGGNDSRESHGQESVGFDGVSSLQPKILDFGVARATDADIQMTTVQTDVGQLIGTLPYMSPEQVAGDPNEVDTRSDVYALGVIAYELLGGRLPHDVARKTVAQAARIIAEQDPTPLSTVNRVLRGDVETIVGKALEKEKARRYQSAADLAADIRRYLRDEPIIARPPTTMYTLSKFAKRNKALVGGVIAVFITLILGIAGMAWYAVEAMEQRNDAVNAQNEAKTQRDAALIAKKDADDARKAAELETEKTRAVNRFLIKDMLGSANPDVAQGQTITVEMVLAEAVKKVGEAFKDQPQLEGSIRGTIAETYLGMGKYQEAFDQLILTHELQLKSVGRTHEDTFASIINLAVVENRLGRLEDSVKRLNDWIPEIEKTLGQDHRSTLTAKQVLLSSLSDLGRFGEVEPVLKSVMEAQARTLGEDHADTQVSISNYAYLLGELGRNAESEPLYRKIYELRLSTLGEAHPKTLSAMANLAITLHELSRFAEAEQLLRQVYDTSRRVLGEDHPSTFDAMANLASYLSIAGKSDEAITLMKDAGERRHRVLGDDHPDTISSDLDLVASLRQLGRYDEAIALGEKTLATSSGKLGVDHPLTMSVANALAVCYHASRNYEKAEPMMRQVWESRRRVLGDEHPDTISSQNNLGAVLVRLNRLDEAEPLLITALDAARRVFGPDHRQTYNITNILAGLRSKQGKVEEAATLFITVIEGRRTLQGPDHPDAQSALDEMVELLTNDKQFERAVKLAEPEYTRCEKEHGADAPLTQRAIKRMVSLYEAQNLTELAQQWRNRLIPATSTTPQPTP